MSRNRKLSYKWLGPYRVQKAIPDKGTYILEEFDRTTLAGTYSGNRLKKFVERHSFYVLVTLDSEGSEGSEGSECLEAPGSVEERLPSTETLVRRSTRIHQQRANTDTPMPDAPTPGRFVIVPPTLTAAQRREYVRYEEDEEGNLV
jgi:hypothetical protein